MKKASLNIFLIISFFTSCVKDKPNPDPKLFPTNSNRGILILNEGAFGNNNSELSFLEEAKNIISNDLFRQANAKSMGDIGQSIQYSDGIYYITLNNSNKIILLDASTFKEISSISQIPSPRYLQVLNQEKAYVSSMTESAVYVLNLKERKVEKTISLDFVGSENMLYHKGFLWVCNWNINSPFIYKINTLTDEVETKINLNCFASHDVIIDKNETIWVLSGNKYKGKSSILLKLNPVTNEIIKKWNFPINQEPIRLSMNKTKDTLFYINVNYDGTSNDNGLYKMGILEQQLPSVAFIPALENSYFWAYGIDPNSGAIYLSDPKGFTQQSAILKYTNQGDFIQQFKAGIGANTFLFR